MTTSARDVKSIFGRALEIESPAARAAYLEEACGTDAGLRAEIEVLLRYHGKAGEFLRWPLATDVTEGYETITEQPGTRPTTRSAGSSRRRNRPGPAPG
jgi:hypothetical protein